MGLIALTPKASGFTDQHLNLDWPAIDGNRSTSNRYQSVKCAPIINTFWVQGTLQPKGFNALAER